MSEIYAVKSQKITERERKHMKLSRMVAAECIVLLENNGTLPLEKRINIALYGNGARFTVKGGTGSNVIRMVAGMEEHSYEMLNKKAVIFDLDGVICFTDQFHYQAWKALADRLGIYFDEKINDSLRGISRIASLEIILGQSNRKYTQEEKEAFAEEKNANYRELLKKLSPADLSEEVKDTLTELRNRGYKLGIGSSSKNTMFILERLGLDTFFDAVADGTEIIYSKPDPEVFLTAADKLGVSPSDCFVVEDAKAGIEAAKAGGMTALALFGDARNCGAEDYNLSSFEDILNALEQI